ncbi:type II toxin-antitoxin system VapC family toxin [Corynebacterium wankanglinii]|uniref:Ribonuclease VapC n=1 Tax=Corynebacterium wankanglinii TaxID=2735136 RepID=A0A838CKB8_9CORY|nr:type II toxin-antitoxin system VapC family toxin [Corynebacterium wankanglinii]MBA1835322.1 type II toxin-antitoxin system VapC family toxin [Corynebacterium wankanglinii]
MILDTSAAIELLLRTDKGDQVLELVSAEDAEIHAPHLLVTEVVQVMRRQVRSNVLDVSRAAESLSILSELGIQFHGHLPLMARTWQLRENVSAYDATFIALAETLNQPLVTADARLGNASGFGATILVI